MEEKDPLLSHLFVLLMTLFFRECSNTRKLRIVKRLVHAAYIYIYIYIYIRRSILLTKFTPSI